VHSDDPRRVLLAVDGADPGRLAATARTLLGASAVWTVVHVIDVRGRVDLGALRRGFVGAGPLPPHLAADIDAAGREYAQVVLSAAAAAFEELHLASEAGLVRLGEPGREICGAASAWAADLVVLRASRRARPEPGPKSVGHTARFVVDHAPCPVLLLRG
jgi:nucleotide-binding universal stress UspA family protein